MTDQTQNPPPQDDEFLAAEAALGLTPADTVDEVRSRLRRDAGFASRVAGWQERFVALTDDIKPVAPHRRVKKALTARLFPKAFVPLMQRVWVWKGISFASIALLAYMAMPLLRPDVPDVPPTLYATQLKGDSALEVLAVVDPARGDVALRRVAGFAPQGRVLELWAILPEQAPISLGVIPDGDVTRVALSAEVLGQIDLVTFAISDEPQGGAPDGAPTGSIMAVGAVSAL